MPRPMQGFWFTVVLIFLFFAPYAPGQAASGSPQFSADIAFVSPEAPDTSKMKMYSDGQKIRMDTILNGTQAENSVIIDPAAHTSTSLMHARKMYIETNALADLHMGPRNPGNPCANEPGVLCTKAGVETVNGRACDKWVYSGSAAEQTVWLDQKLHVPIKLARSDGAIFLLQNLQEGPQDPNLFIIPKDYRKFEASAVSGGYFGDMPYSFFLFGPLSLILRAICVVHWFRRRPAGYWLWIIFIGGTIGAIAYIAIEMVPDVTLLRHAFAFVGRNKRIGALNIIVQDNPAPGNYEELGDLYLDAKKYPEARAAFDRAITTRTSHAGPFYGRALANIELKDYAAAEPDLQRVFAIDPKHDFQRAAGLLAYVFYKNGKNDEAGRLFAEVTQTSTISETLYNYAEFLAAQGNAAEARASLQRVLNKKATLPVYLKRRERPWFRKARTLLKTIPQTAN